MTRFVSTLALIAGVSTVAARFWGIGVGFWLGALPAAPLSLLAFSVVSVGPWVKPGSGQKVLVVVVVVVAVVAVGGSDVTVTVAIPSSGSSSSSSRGSRAAVEVVVAVAVAVAVAGAAAAAAAAAISTWSVLSSHRNLSKADCNDLQKVWNQS